MKCVKIRDLELGKGMPKICVPIVGTTDFDILEAVNRIMSLEKLPDMIEFRVDWYENVFDADKVKIILEKICEKVSGLPVLFTFRTALEGGEKEISLERYKELLSEAAKSGFIDAVDVEAFSFGEDMSELVQSLHKEDVIVIGSNHDFKKTPDTQELINRLHAMNEMRMDIAKIAVMPQGTEDVCRLLEVTGKALSDDEMCPVITMSMSGRGVVSRLAGEVFGSVLTFASAGKASAPGQIEIDKLRQVLEIIHESC